MEIVKESLILERKGVKPTANRILVLRTMLAASHPISLRELVMLLETMDKSSIFRVLNIFSVHHIVHAIEDGSGTIKYEICSGEKFCSIYEICSGEKFCSIHDMHTHFYCEVCHQTFCFKNIHIPEIQLPEGFFMDSINYMVKGVCAKCSRKPASK